MAEDDIRLKDALIGIVAISAMDVLLVVTVFVMMKSGLAAGGLGTIMPAALALSVAVPTAMAATTRPSCRCYPPAPMPVRRT